MTIRKIFVPLSGQYNVADPKSLERPAIESAFHLGRNLGAHVEVLCIEAELLDSPSRLSPWLPGHSTEMLLEMIDKESVERQQRIRDLFQSVAQSFSAPLVSEPSPDVGFSVNFLEEVGRVQKTLSVRGRLSDLIVTACFPLERDGGIPRILEVALCETGRPVLITPIVAKQASFERIAIAWNGSSEAMRSVGLAMEFLTSAKDVVIISVSEGPPFEPSASSLAEFLRWHGVQPRILEVEGTAITSGSLVLDHVTKENADLLVMGAYTRSRVRRIVCGDVTGEVLDQMKIPVFMVD